MANVSITGEKHEDFLPLNNKTVPQKTGSGTYRSLIRLLRSFPIGLGSGLLVAVLLLTDVSSQLASPLITQALVDGISSGNSVAHLIVALTCVMLCSSILGSGNS